MERLQEISSYYHLMAETDALYQIIQKKSGLSFAEFWVLAAIRIDGLSYQHEIARSYGINRQTVNSALRHLSEKGLAFLESEKDNQKVKKVILTEKGISFAEKYIDTMVNLENKAWLALSEEERSLLVSATEHFNKVFRKEIGGES